MKVEILESSGNIKKGNTYIRGLYEAPKFHRPDNKDNWFWMEDKKEEENYFLHKNVINHLKHEIL